MPQQIEIRDLTNGRIWYGERDDIAWIKPQGEPGVHQNTLVHLKSGEEFVSGETDDVRKRMRGINNMGLEKAGACG